MFLVNSKKHGLILDFDKLNSSFKCLGPKRIDRAYINSKLMEDNTGMRKKFWNKELSEKISTNTNNMLEMKTNISEIFNIND